MAVGPSDITTIDRSRSTTYTSRDPIVVQGVVRPSGQAGWEDGAHKVHALSFIAWCVLGGDFYERQLYTMRVVEPGTQFADGPQDWSIQQLSVILDDTARRAVVHEHQNITALDPRLVEAAQRLQEPVIVSAGDLENLQLDRSLDLFSGTVRWADSDINISLDADGDEPLAELVDLASSLVGGQDYWLSHIHAKSVSELLPIKNDGWLEDGESPLSAEEFVRRMTLKAITLSEGGHIEFHLDDGDLFWGHHILVSANQTDGVTDAQFWG